MEDPNDITDREFYGEDLRQSRRLAEELEEAQGEIAELTEERARVRLALLEEISRWREHQSTARQTQRSIGANTALAVFVNALDRIFPEDWQERPATRPAWTPLSFGSLPHADRSLLVTNNLTSRLANGQMAMLWLVSAVHCSRPRNGSREEFYAYTREGELVRWLTHWRLAVPEEG